MAVLRTVVYYFLYCLSEYAMESDKWCPHTLPKVYNNISSAEDACNQMWSIHKNCSVIYSGACSGNHYEICTSDTAIKASSAGSCVFRRPSK